jgi:hypothetical protein
MRVIRATALFAGILLVGLGRARADLLTYVHEAPFDNSQQEGLYNFDTTTGISSLRVPLPSTTPRIFGLGTRPSDGAVFGLTVSGQVISLNPNTGAIATIGNTGLQGQSLAFRPSDGTLFIELATNTAPNTFVFSLNTFNLSTGATTFVANIGTEVTGSTTTLSGVTGSLAFSPSGVLYGFTSGGSSLTTGSLYTINTTTGATSLIGPGNHPFYSLIGATFGPSGKMFVSDYNLGQISQVDLTSGNRTSVGSVDADEVTGLIVAPPAAVPEPSSLVTLGIAALLGLGFSLRRRSQTALNTNMS